MSFRKALLFTSFLSLGIPLSAQYNTLNEWYIGPSGGATMSTITMVPKLVDKLYTFNKDYGVAVRYISEGSFGVQMEINHYESGWKEDLQGLGKNYSYSRKLNFVEVPLLVHAYKKYGHARCFINAGPQMSFLQSESEEIVDNSTNFVQHGKKVEKPFQYGLLGGAGAEVHFQKSVIGIEGRYHYNLSDIFNDAVGDEFNTSSIQSISLNLYYLFRIK